MTNFYDREYTCGCRGWGGRRLRSQGRHEASLVVVPGREASWQPFLFNLYPLTSELPTFFSPSAPRLLFSTDFAAGYFQARTIEHRESLSNNSSEGFVAPNPLDLRKTIMITVSLIGDLLCWSAESLPILLTPHGHHQR